MASAESQKPSCPVCHQADQVKTMQAAYNTGVARCAPPDLPTKNVRMLPYITACVFLVGICIFFVVTLVGGLESRLPQLFQLVLLSLTLISIVTALVVSYISFQKVVRGDNEAAELYPAYDQAMETWNHLDYCSRDDIVFDPQSSQKVSNEKLVALRSLVKSATQNELRSAVAGH